MPINEGISSIVVSYNCLDSLKKCIGSLQNQRGIVNEIIVVDNDSVDGTVDYLKKRKLTTIFPGKNLGYGQAANLAAEKAEGKYLFILNPDTEFPPSTLADLYNFAERSDNVGLISPLLIYPDGRPQLSAREFPRRTDILFGRGSPLFWLGITGEKKAGYIRPADERPLEVPAVSATAIFIRKELFERIGGFDRRFFLYLEDLDLCKRIEQEGGKIILLPPVRVTHLWRASSRKRRFFAAFYHHRSVWKYFVKHYPDQRIYNTVLFVALVLGFVVSSVLMALGIRRED